MWFVCPTLATFKKNSIGSTGTLPKGFGICMILHFFAFFFNRVLLAVFLFSCFLFHGKAHSEIERTCGGIKDWVQKLEGETPKDAQKAPRKLIKLFISIGAVPGGLGAAPHGDLFTNTAAG